MSYAIWIKLSPLLGMLALAAFIDARSRRIPNWLTFSLALCGFAQSLTLAHSVGPGSSVLGLLVGFSIMLVQFALGAIGGGDVKLMAAVGAWVGPLPVLAVFLAASVVGLVIVVAQAAWQGRMRALVRNSAVVAVNIIHVRELGVAHASETGGQCRSIDRPLPYAVPVLFGTIAVMAGPWLLS